MALVQYPIAKTGDYLCIYEKSLTISNTAYSAGDNIGELMEISNATAGADENGTIEQIEILEVVASGQSAQKASIQFYFQKTTFASGDDNAAFSLTAPGTDTDVIGIAGTVATADYVDVAGASTDYTIVRKAVSVPFKNSTDTTLYGRLISSGTPQYGSGSKVIARVYIKRH